MLINDDDVDRCHARHTEPDDECVECQVRLDTVSCDNCGGVWDKGAGRVPGDCPTPHHPVDHSHYLRDGFGRLVLCPICLLWEKRDVPVTMPGADYCDHHQGLVDAVEASKVMARLAEQRMAAQR